jgi:hypothetical protein
MTDTKNTNDTATSNNAPKRTPEERETLTAWQKTADTERIEIGRLRNALEKVQNGRYAQHSDDRHKLLAQTRALDEKYVAEVSNLRIRGNAMSEAGRTNEMRLSELSFAGRYDDAPMPAPPVECKAIAAEKAAAQAGQAGGAATQPAASQTSRGPAAAIYANREAKVVRGIR